VSGFRAFGLVSGFRLALEPAVWTYVIVHELLHFDIPNHGKLWKSLMRAHVGDWERCEDVLRERASRVR